ncbi:MAG: hypothetical protein R6V00_12930 [Candidatus Aminicenantes bacterium]
MKFRHSFRSVQIFNAILLCFSRLLRNSPRSWVRHTRRPASPDTLEKTHQKAKSSKSLNLYLNFTGAKGFLFIFLMVGVFLSQFSWAQSDYSLEEALKVLELIEKVEAEKGIDYSGPLREVVVTESELNSYLAFRIEHEEDVMKELKLKLFDENRIEGKVLLRFKGQNLPLLLNPRMVFYFDGVLKVKQGAARLVVRELFLNKEPVEPFLLDTVIYLSSKFLGTENSGLNEWYELPYGIKDVRIKQGQAYFYY